MPRPIFKIKEKISNFGVYSEQDPGHFCILTGEIMLLTRLVCPEITSSIGIVCGNDSYVNRILIRSRSYRVPWTESKTDVEVQQEIDQNLEESRKNLQPTNEEDLKKMAEFVVENSDILKSWGSSRERERRRPNPQNDNRLPLPRSYLRRSRMTNIWDEVISSKISPNLTPN